MKTILVFVSTLDGKVTKWNDPFVGKWTSKSDQEYFSKIWKGSELIITGSSTFDADPKSHHTSHLILVMTHRPADYKRFEVLGRLEFSDESPIQLYKRFEKEGYERMTVVGGPHIATSFLKEQLIDELWLTIEPKIFGTGSNFAVDEELDISLKLLSCEKVNEQGTLITKYAIIKNQQGAK
jgi:dihydrofolate reductase